MQNKRKLNKFHRLRFFGLLMLFVLPAASGFADKDGIVNILKPQVNVNPCGLIFFTDPAGACNIAYQYQHENIPNEIYCIKSRDGVWLSPIRLNLKSWSNVYLCDVKNLSDNTPLMLILGDNTDYARLFDVSGIQNGKDLLPALGMTEEELSVMLLKNQRLFAGFQLNGQWVEPAPISGTYGATTGIIAAGSNGSALVLFYRDGDNNVETIGDIDLFATVYNKGAWSTPLRITNNEKNDYGAQAVFVRDKYLVVWGSDEDNNIETNDDRLLNYAVVGKDGQEVVKSTVIINQFQNNPIPILGRSGEKGILIWSSAPIAEDDPRRPIWEVEYEGNWQLPRKTDLLNYQMGNGSLYEIGSSLVLIYREAGTLQAAVKDGNGWFTNGTLLNSSLLSLDASGIYYSADGNSNLHIGFTGFIPGKEKNYENEFDGIYYTQRSLKSDLTFYGVETSPRKKRIGQEVELEFPVYNAGSMKSGPFTVLVKDERKPLKELVGEELAAGKEQVFKYKFKIEKATTNLELEIITASQESSKENNKLTFPLKILPDYTVRSVARNDAGQVTARIVEDKNIAAPPVAVDFYAVINGESRKIGNATYDPIADEPVTISWQNPAPLSAPFQLIAEVNHERTIQEDDYANNKGSFIYNPLPDFVVQSFTTSRDAISVTLNNIGEKTAAQIDILITDNPEVVVADDINAVFGNLHYYQEVTLDENQSARLDINYSGLDALIDKRIYAIVNPNGTAAETNQNNNLATTLVKLRDSLPSGKRQLIFGAVYGYSSNITVTLVNTSGEPAISPKVELVNSEGIVVDQQVVPVVKAHGWSRILFTNVARGNYKVRLVTNWMGNVPDVLETSVKL